MTRVGNTLRFLFIIRAAFGIRLDDGGASEASLDSDYYDHAQGVGASHGELIETTDDSGLRWINTHFDVSQHFDFEACDAASLAEIGSDANSSSESLIHGLDDGGDNASSSKTKVKVKASSKSARVKYDASAGSLQTSGSTHIVVTLNKTVSKRWKNTKTWSFPVYHVGAFAVYINVGLKYDLNMSGDAGFEITVPINWDVCVTKHGNCPSYTNKVWVGSISFEKWLYVTVKGSAKVSASIQFEKAGLVTTSAQVISKMTLNNNDCTVRYDYHLRFSALKTLTWLADKIGGVVSWTTGYCFSGFGELSLGNLLNGKIWEGSCR